MEHLHARPLWLQWELSGQLAQLIVGFADLALFMRRLQRWVASKE